MPTYDYQCRSCGVIAEVVHSMLEDGPTECEQCGGELRRIFHPTGIIFRGGGFYKTDSRPSSASSVASGTSGDGASTTTTPKESGSGESAKKAAPSADTAKTGSAGSD